MKRLISSIVICFCLLSFQVDGQSFYFEEKETTLVKTTSQTPAHWYIEIFSSATEDVTLRWKAVFESIPPEWSITFNDQTINHEVVEHGDSSDFVLFSEPELPQKLIIGAHLNNTVGSGTVLFEIFDPLFPEEKDTIHFHFRISQGALGIEEVIFSDAFKIEQDQVISLTGETAVFCVYNESGKEVVKETTSECFDLSVLQGSGLYFLVISRGKEYFYLKIQR